MTFTRRQLLKAGVLAAGLPLTHGLPSLAKNAANRPGPFQPTWDSLAQYKTPEWFRDAKFGMWAHWGPQCEPGQGDWYARQMYEQGNPDYNYQCATYGHPSKAGFKDVIPHWRAESWDPEHLIGLYKRAGAKYFMAMANHHDNFDNFASTYQPWNSVALGPKRDIIGEWEKVVRNAGLRFAVSVHAAHAWLFYELAQSADSSGPLKGVPYDGNLTLADGKGLWWEGYDPQALYAQAHTPSQGFPNPGVIGSQWAWGNGATPPTAAYIDKFSSRILELIDKYHPDQIYFDDTVLPFYPISDAGLRIAAYFYNENLRRNGTLEAVINGKILNAQQQQCMVLDLERGVSNEILPLPYQTDTCIGNWHYDINLYHRHGYKTVNQVAHMLVDIVSKNGNLMLNIPLPGSGLPDPDELAFVEEWTQWMNVNSEGIYASRPWARAVEGPSGSGPSVHAQGFNESNRAYTSEDFRFTKKGETIYAYAMDWPDNGQWVVRSLGQGAGRVDNVRLLGYPGKLRWAQTPQGLTVAAPPNKPCDYVYGLRIDGRGLAPVDFSSVQPIQIMDTASGSLRLLPQDASLSGGVQLQISDGVSNIGYWNASQDTVTWKANFPAAGSYRVSASVAAADGPSALLLDFGSGITSLLSVPNTGDWGTFQTVQGGVISIPAAGIRTLVARAADPAAWHAINLGIVTITRE